MIDLFLLLFATLTTGAEISGLGYLLKAGYRERKKWRRSKELMCILVPWSEPDFLDLKWPS